MGIIRLSMRNIFTLAFKKGTMNLRTIYSRRLAYALILGAFFTVLFSVNAMPQLGTYTLREQQFVPTMPSL